MSEVLWELKPEAQLSEIEKLRQELNISATTASLLLQRGISTFDKAKAFFNPSFDDLHAPILMKDMDKAIQLLSQAIDDDWRILVYGDYDVDGTTAVSLMFDFLKEHCTEVDYYIPDRYAEGYGLSQKGVQYAIDNEFRLIITLDCGIKSVEKFQTLKDAGVKSIICDHHRPGEVLPPADAVLDPKRSDCTYPFKELSGCGIGFKLLCGLAKSKGIFKEEIYNYLDLVAISTACDIVPMVGENRILVSKGLELICNKNCRSGVAALMNSKEPPYVVMDLVFVAGPRINAAGRMKHAKAAVELLLSDEASAQDALKEINSNNNDRKSADSNTTKEALEMISSDADFESRKSTVVFNSEWIKGVVGIVASRLIETHYRPTIVLTESNGKAVGSARSVRDFDVYEAIAECSDLLEQFGGHTYAAGLTLPIKNVNAFAKKFDEVVASTISDDQLIPKIEVDAEISFAEISDNFCKILRRMEPFGPQNMSPVFLSKKVFFEKEPFIMGKERNHFKILLNQNEYYGEPFEAVGFSMEKIIDELEVGKTFDVLYHIEENNFRGNTRIQLRLKDIRPSEA